ncbi:hypothetical protein PR048_015752 [Dryococelus australis]|uniref:Prolactin receptor n=1 Tax=Dryococelus australis TaxID=614101 RepID=A0ABQ9HI14_9NEOP|nr:hypothetical protein PR048_015752 [Dryococelus australis]
MQGQMCWYVSSDIRSDLGLTDLKVPNTWEYNLKPRRTVDSENLNLSATTCAATTDSSNKTCPSSGQLITKFTKVLSDQERQRQLSPKAGHNEPEQGTKTKRKIIFHGADSPSRLQTSHKKLALTGFPSLTVS